MIAVIIVEHDHDREIVLLADAESGEAGIVVKRAVADQAQNRPLRVCRFDAEGSARASAEAADATGKKSTWFEHVEIAMDRESMGDGFLDDDRIGWNHLR